MRKAFFFSSILVFGMSERENYHFRECFEAFYVENAGASMRVLVEGILPVKPLSFSFMADRSELIFL